jgi:hypothetical protein
MPRRAISMNIYSQFVFPDKLISPVTGYSCKRITTQNIKQFGFETLGDLHYQFPEFPTKTVEYYNQSCAGTAKGRKLKKDKKLSILEEYNKSPSLCETCVKKLPYSKRNNRFCSARCAVIFYNTNRTEVPAHIKKKIGLGLKRYNESKPKYSNIYFLKCEECEKAFTHNNRTKFCSVECRSARYSRNGRKAAALNNRRSKDEIRLFELCVAKFPSAKPNLIIQDGWDADIVIDDLRIAILWNGPWHYKDIKMVGHSLLQVQTRDRIKTDLFTRLGWTVLVYEDRYYTPESAFEDIKRRIGS